MYIKLLCNKTYNKNSKSTGGRQACNKDNKIKIVRKHKKKKDVNLDKLATKKEKHQP